MISISKAEHLPSFWNRGPGGTRKWPIHLDCFPYRVFSLTWPASLQIYWNKRKRLHKKRVHLPQDWFETPTWPPFHCWGNKRMRIVIPSLSSATSREVASISDWFISNPLFIIGGNTHNNLGWITFQSFLLEDGSWRVFDLGSKGGFCRRQENISQWFVQKKIQK